MKYVLVPVGIIGGAYIGGCAGMLCALGGDWDTGILWAFGGVAIGAIVGGTVAARVIA